jgi:hypothetical protein
MPRISAMIKSNPPMKTLFEIKNIPEDILKSDFIMLI